MQEFAGYLALVRYPTLGAYPRSLIPNKIGLSQIISRAARERLTKGIRQTMMSQFLKQFVADDAGQDLIEYALVAALVGIAAVSGLRVLRNSIGNTFNSVGTSLTSAV